MTARIPDDVLAVAAVVTGGQPAHLVGEQRREAIAAMHALGYSREHMQAMLLISPQKLRDAAHDVGVRLHNHDQRYDPFAVLWVCLGTRMPLRGADREEALRRLGPFYTATEIAWLCCTTHAQIQQLASRLKVSTNAGRPVKRAEVKV